MLVDLCDAEGGPGEKDIKACYSQYTALLANPVLLHMLPEAAALSLRVVQNVRYVGFDFHKMCGANKWENLSVLFEQVQI